MRGLLEIAIRLPTRKAGIFPDLCDGIRQMIESLQQFARVIEAHGPLRIAGTDHVPHEYNHMRHIASTSLRTSSGTLIRAQNRSYLLRPWSNASVLVHFRGFSEASVQQFVQQPRGDVSRDYLASLRRSRTASTRIKMGRVPRSACSALRTRTCEYQSTSEPRPQRKKPSSLPPRTGRPVHGHSFPAESLRSSRRSRNL